MNKKVVLPVVILVLMVTMLACQFTGLTTTPQPTLSVAPTPAVTMVPVDLASQQDRLVALYQNTGPGVVTIITSVGLGSGWVYSSDGYIVTNAHVVGTDTQVEVDFPNGNKVFGKVVGADHNNTDLAVIKVDVPADQLHPLPLGDSDTLQVGQTVVAIGNPFGFGETMTTGTITALGRSQLSASQPSTNGYFSTGDVVQTDALLNHGNSGGALLDLNGEVMGITDAIQVDPYTGANSGLGYAISVDLIKRVVPSLVQTGGYDYPYLGIYTKNDLPLEVINALGLKSTSGTYIVSVTAGGPAEKAGLRGGTQPVNITTQGYTDLLAGGDLIIGVDGKTMLTYDDLLRYLASHKSPGDTIMLTILRGDQQMDIPLVLGVRP